jgi:hypothetical protein
MAQKERAVEDGAKIVDKDSVETKFVDKQKKEESEAYSCFPWLFNPGLTNIKSRLYRI